MEGLRRAGVETAHQEEARTQRAIIVLKARQPSVFPAAPRSPSPWPPSPEFAEELAGGGVGW